MSMVCCCSLAGTNACLTCNVARRYTQPFPQPIVIAPVVVKQTDLVEVIRCKDCKHYHKAEPTKGDISNVSYCTIEDDDLISFPNENDYCSRGERKDEGEE